MRRAAQASADAGSPVERLRRLCLDFRRALFAHPGVAQRLKASLPPVGPHVIALTEAALGLLLEAGVEPGLAPRAFGMLVQFVTATADDEAHALAEFGTEHAWREAVRARYASLSADAYPSVAAMAAGVDGHSFQGDFEDGLDLLLDGIVRRGAGRRHTSR